MKIKIRKRKHEKLLVTASHQTSHKRKSRVPYTKALSQSTSGFRFLHHLTDHDEPVTLVFLISQHRESYKPSENGAICASAYLLCAQWFYLALLKIIRFYQ